MSLGQVDPESLALTEGCRDFQFSTDTVRYEGAYLQQRTVRHTEQKSHGMRFEHVPISKL